MDFLPHVRTNGKAHARFSRYSTSSDDIPPDVEARAKVEGDNIPVTKAREFIEHFGEIVERPMVLFAIVSLAENNKRNGKGLYAYCSHEFLAERLLGDRSLKAAKRIGRHIKYFKGEYGLVEVTSRRPSAVNRKQQTNLYRPTRKCFEFIAQLVNFAVGGVFLGGNSTKDENRLLVLEREEKRRVILEDEKRLSPAQEQATEQTMPLSATTDTGEEEQKNGGEEKEKREGTANTERCHVIRNILSLSTPPYQASQIETQVAKLVRQYPERTKLLQIRVREQERDGTSQSTILQALAETEAANPGHYATYFTAKCEQLRQKAEISEAARQRGLKGIRARNKQYSQWEEERIDYIPDLEGMIRKGLARKHERNAMQAERTSP